MKVRGDGSCIAMRDAEKIPSSGLCMAKLYALYDGLWTSQPDWESTWDSQSDRVTIACGETMCAGHQQFQEYWYHGEFEKSYTLDNS